MPPTSEANAPMTSQTEAMRRRLRTFLSEDEMPQYLQPQFIAPASSMAFTHNHFSEVSSFQAITHRISDLDIHASDLQSHERRHPPSNKIPDNDRAFGNFDRIKGVNNYSDSVSETMQPFALRQSHQHVGSPFNGQSSTFNDSFSPVLAVSKIPYKFVRSKTLMERMANACFNDGKFWRHGWHLFYIWPINVNPSKPLVLVPTTQVEDFFRKINLSVDGVLPLLDDITKCEPGMRITFPYLDARTRPRFLGRCWSRESYTSLIDNCPREECEVPGTTTRYRDVAAPDDQINDCNVRIALALDLVSGKKSASEKTQSIQKKEREGQHHLAQLERFFGLRPAKYQDVPSENEWQELSWEESQAREAAKRISRELPPIDPMQPPNCPFDSTPIFISIDIEWYERDQGKVTEIGISTLDTADLPGIAPGLWGVNWYSYIRSRHFRVKEYAHLVNREFVQGCPGAFHFGTSEFVKLENVAKSVAACFQPPHSNPLLDQQQHIHRHTDTKRTIVLVGHGIANDLRCLQKLGCDVTNLSTRHPSWPIADTQVLYRALRKQRDNVKLASILDEFDIQPWNLHNAGNDAAYTLQAMISIAVDSASSREQ